MQERLKTIHKTFVTSIVLLATASVVSLAAVLYTTNAIRLNRNVNASHLHSLTADYPELSAYIENQKEAEPHFVKIANLVKSDQQKLIGRALLYTGIPVLLSSAFIGYILARRLLQPVEETFASQERFLQDASHEMRNPLAAMSAVIQDAKANPTATGQKKALDVLDRQVAHLVKLNEDLLLLERTKQAAKKAYATNASELLLDVIESTTAQAHKQQIALKPTVQPDVFVALSDRDFVCIVRNVLENAIKYSAPHSAVSVRLKGDKQSATIVIKDKGIGIPKAQLRHIGERFYRARNVGRKPGTGLGMAIVHQIVHNAKGSLHIKSIENKGTAVTVTLPAGSRKQTSPLT